MDNLYYLITVTSYGPSISGFPTMEERETALSEMAKEDDVRDGDDVFFLDFPDGEIYSVEIPFFESEDSDG
jgi:hypothetical protein